MYNFSDELAILDNMAKDAKAHEDAINALERKLSAHKATLKGINDRRELIKKEMASKMIADGCLEHEEDGIKYKLRKLPQRLEVLCKPEELPEEYQRIKVEADKKKLKAEYKDGLSANYCKLSDVEYKLEIVHD